MTARTFVGPAIRAAALLGVLAAVPSAQSNAVPGLEVSLGKLQDMRYWGTVSGTVGISMSTTSCNLGSVVVPFLPANSGVMQEDHPFIAFIIAREKDGRFEQISDRSYVKHGFCALSDSDCTACTEPPFPITCTTLGLGCSDTYSVFNNGDQFYLGPAGEIDPWLGTWEASCSYFDAGSPPVAPPGDCNGQRSLTSTQLNNFTAVQARVQVPAADLANPGGDIEFYYQAQYVVEGEPEASRTNNLGSRRFTPNQSGGNWTFTPSGATPLMSGTILQRWDGATVRSGKNGNDDGRVYIASRVTGPVNGRYHFEYAVHNRDNRRGIGAIRLPTCPEARFFDVGFQDVDGNAGNDWTFTHTGDEIVLETTDNPLDWNTIYNFWFDSDAGLGTEGTAVFEQFDAGVGADSLSMPSSSPNGLYNVHLGAGCSNGTAPDLFATGSPAQATIGNATFGLGSNGHDANGFLFWLLDFSDGALPLGGGCTYFGGGLAAFVLTSNQADGSGDGALAFPIPPDATLEGGRVNVQVLSFRAGGGPIGGSFDLSDGLRVRIGDAVPACP